MHAKDHMASCEKQQRLSWTVQNVLDVAVKKKWMQSKMEIYASLIAIKLLLTLSPVS